VSEGPVPPQQQEQKPPHNTNAQHDSCSCHRTQPRVSACGGCGTPPLLGAAASASHLHTTHTHTQQTAHTCCVACSSASSSSCAACATSGALRTHGCCCCGACRPGRAIRTLPGRAQRTLFMQTREPAGRGLAAGRMCGTSLACSMTSDLLLFSQARPLRVPVHASKVESVNGSMMACAGA
jgi:hypothetical protein